MDVRRFKLTRNVYWFPDTSGFIYTPSVVRQTFAFSIEPMRKSERALIYLSTARRGSAAGRSDSDVRDLPAMASCRTEGVSLNPFGFAYSSPSTASCSYRAWSFVCLQLVDEAAEAFKSTVRRSSCSALAYAKEVHTAADLDL